MIQYKIGNLITALKEGEVDAIAHQANCFCTMRSGIAPQIAREWPSVIIADSSTRRGDKNKLGSVTRAVTQNGTVFNIYGQYHWLRSHPEYGTSYDHLGSGLKLVRLLMDTAQTKRLGLPLIGCGLAGGDWGRVSGLIEEAFKDFTGTVTVYTLTPVEGLDYGVA